MDELFEFDVNDDIYDGIIKYNLKDRRIVLNQEVDFDLLEKVVLRILQWNQEDKGKILELRKPIYIYLSSVGGDVIAGFNLIDAITVSETPIYGVVYGLAASMAGYILMACDKRYAFSNSVILVHDGQLGIYGTTSKAKDIMGFYDKMSDRVKDFVLNNTKITEDFYDSIYNKEYYMYSDRAKELGIVDYIIGEDATLSEIL